MLTIQTIIGSCLFHINNSNFCLHLGVVNALTAGGFSETGPFMHLSNHVCRSHLFQKYLSYEARLFWKCSKFNLDSKNAIKLQQNIFGFLDSCIWTGGGKFPLLLQKYSQSAVNVLKGHFDRYKKSSVYILFKVKFIPWKFCTLTFTNF